jgi:hypothetical protein
MFSGQGVLLHNFKIGTGGLLGLIFSVYRGLSGTKRSERDVDHSPPSRVEFKNEWSYTSNFLIRLNGLQSYNFMNFTLVSPVRAIVRTFGMCEQILISTHIIGNF